MSVYRQLVQAGERRKDWRGLSAHELSRLTWTAEDRRAWNDTYRACLLVAVRRDERMREEAVPLAVNVAVFNLRGPRIFEARRYGRPMFSVHVDCMQKEGS